jgi:hypothetical protein
MNHVLVIASCMLWAIAAPLFVLWAVSERDSPTQRMAGNFCEACLMLGFILGIALLWVGHP